MALNPYLLNKLCEKVKTGDKIASMGYPDIICNPKKLIALKGVDLSGLVFREDSKLICARHGISEMDVPDSKSLFGLLGASLAVFDIVEERGGEIICDLNEPIQPQYHAEYDFVLDVGTLEHCFNIAQAAINMAGLVKVGGTILHENPFNWGNHGFYNLNPTFFYDFYEENGFAVLENGLSVSGSMEVIPIPPYKRFKYTGPEVNLITVARRHNIVPFSYPKQTKYRKADAGIRAK